jgi:hypothetical protein
MPTFEEVEILRRKYARAKKELIESGVNYHDPAPRLNQKLIKNCRLIENREKLLEYLPKRGVCAEIGTDKGAFANKILSICEPKKLFLFEVDISRIKRDNVQDAIADGRCEIVEGISYENLNKFSDNFFDWVYIDGDHFYDGVRKDLEICREKVKDDGVIVLNDYAVWSPVGMIHCGVARAVNEFCIQNGYELLYFAFEPMMYNDVVIKKMK